MDNLLSHPFADLFALLSPDSIPKWTSVVDLLRRLSNKEHQLGEDDAVTEWLEKLENARDLLRETEEQLVELYFDRHINNLAEAGALAIGEAHARGDQEPELAHGEVARQQQGSEVEYEGNAEVEICRRLMRAVDLAEGVSGQGSEVHDLDIEECENADIHIASHQAARNSGRRQAIVVHDLHIEECENAHIQAASHQDDGASIQAIEVRDFDVEEWENASHQAGGVEFEGNAEVEICLWLQRVMDWDEGASGQASEGHDVDIEELEMTVAEVAIREDSASRHPFEGASGQAGEEDPDEDEGNKDVEMS